MSSDTSAYRQPGYESELLWAVNHVDYWADGEPVLFPEETPKSLEVEGGEQTTDSGQSD